MPEIAQLAEAILAMSKRSWIEASRETAEITESEFLALDYLTEAGTATVGEAQQHIGVVPAQMSRLLRRMESAELVKSDINREDRRRVDITSQNRVGPYTGSTAWPSSRPSSLR